MISRINRKICYWIDKIAYNNVLRWRAGYSNGRFANYAQSHLSNQEKEAI